MHLVAKAAAIKLVLTDSDGVLTDTGVYYSSEGEVMKRFSIRDGMGVERLRNILGIETGIITGELSDSVLKRAEKLKIKHFYRGVKNKKNLLADILKEHQLDKENIAYIGDDVNDLEFMSEVGLSAAPADGTVFIKNIAHYICENKGGNGAFREFAELLIALKAEN
ncbi:MAG TPA: HAD-IIIA family hydrolase, partial [Ignavibacteriaceae bacterium]|nr:HAD-IIIA family hydrolase [Ignavibacteriaceae bacterium]